MATKTIVVCDMCGATKGMSNHWFKVLLKGSVNKSITALPWASSYGDNYKDICGEECLHKWIDQNLPQLNKSTENTNVGNSES